MCPMTPADLPDVYEVAWRVGSAVEALSIPYFLGGSLASSSTSSSIFRSHSSPTSHERSAPTSRSIRRRSPTQFGGGAPGTSTSCPPFRYGSAPTSLLERITCSADRSTAPTAARRASSTGVSQTDNVDGTETEGEEPGQPVGERRHKERAERQRDHPERTVELVQPVPSACVQVQGITALRHPAPKSQRRAPRRVPSLCSITVVKIPLRFARTAITRNQRKCWSSHALHVESSNGRAKNDKAEQDSGGGRRRSASAHRRRTPARPRARSGTRESILRPRPASFWMPAATSTGTDLRDLPGAAGPPGAAGCSWTAGLRHRRCSGSRLAPWNRSRYSPVE